MDLRGFSSKDSRLSLYSGEYETDLIPVEPHAEVVALLIIHCNAII
jgi:hypothetical protein